MLDDLWNDQQYCLNGAIIQGVLSLKLTVTHQKCQQSVLLSARISVVGDSVLQKWFDSEHELMNHLRSKQHVRIDQQAKILHILVSPRKGKFVEVAQCQLKEEVNQYEYQLTQIIARCKSTQNLNQSELKQMFLILAKQIKQNHSILRQQPENEIPKSSQCCNCKVEITKIKNECQQKIAEMRSNIQSLKNQMLEIQMMNSPSELFGKKCIGKQHELQAFEMIDHSSKDFPHLKLHGAQIRVEKGVWGAYVFGIMPISSKNTFTIRVEKFKSYISLGIADHSLKDSGIMLNDHHILYDTRRRLYTAGQVKCDQGKQFKKGESVTVRVHISLGKIEWIVGTEIRYEHESPQIKNNYIEWVPVIYLPDLKDSIIWVD